MRTRALMSVFLAVGPFWTLMSQTAEQPTPISAESSSSPQPTPVEAPPPVVPASNDSTEASQSTSIIVDAAHPPVVTVVNKDTLSVDFPDEDIRVILRNVADLFELNLVVPDTLQGRTSIKLRDVTWRQIFQVVLSQIGYTFIEDGNIIKVVAEGTLAIEPVTTEVFIINYAKAEDIKPTIDSLIEAAAGGRAIIDKRSNALVITERPSRMSRIRPIIERLDKATAQVMIESKFVEVTNRDVKNIGVNWASLSGYQVGVGDIQQSFAKTRGQTSLQGDRVESSQTVDGSFVETNTEIGSTLTNTNGFENNTLSQQINQLVNDGDISRTATAVFSAADFNVILSALKTQSDTKLVSNPTVVTLNNSEANINIGEEFPIPSYTYNSERGSFEVSGFEYKQIGIILKVTPQVNSQGFIKLTIEPEVSSRAGTTTFGGGGGSSAAIPIISTRKTKTQVSLRDGYTMGIGGLIENTTTKGVARVPVLGSIPVLGRLFRSDSTNEDARNLLIFITAKTVSPEGATLAEVFDPRVIRSIGLQKDELPGYRDGSDPFAPPPPPPKPLFKLTPGGDPLRRTQ